MSSGNSTLVMLGLKVDQLVVNVFGWNIDWLLEDGMRYEESKLRSIKQLSWSTV